jgi:hypothetical protein
VWFETLRANKCLKSLKLDGCNLGDKVLKEIAKGITGHNSLQKLSVRLCAAEDSSIKKFGDIFAQPSPLLSLNLSENFKVSEEAFIYMFEKMMKSKYVKLTKFNL